MRFFLRPTALFAMVTVAILFASCAESEPLTMPLLSSVSLSSSSTGLSSSSADSTGLSSSADSTGVDDGDKIEEAPEIPQLTGFALSRWVNVGELLLRWDAPTWQPSAVTGVVIERDRNYTGWVPLDTLSGDAIRQGLWFDRTLDNTTQMKYRYRVYSLVIDSAGVPRRSPFSSIVGTMALDTWGFIDVEFDSPNGFTGCWMHRTHQNLVWNVKRMAQAGGWVLQALAGQDTILYVDSTRAGDIEGFHPTDSVYVVRGTWVDLDTLSEDNNHYHIHWPQFVVYRIYAYYLDEFAGLTSEYSPEVNLSSLDITCFKDLFPYKTAGITLDTTKAVMEWTGPSAFYDCQQVTMGGAYYPPTCEALSTRNCITITDEYGVASPCWDLGMEALSVVAGMETQPSLYNIRGVALNRTKDRIWAASPWRRK